MKNTEEASANTVFAQAKKEGEIAVEEEAEDDDEEEEEEEEDDEEEEEENTEHKNEMYFYLIGDPSYQIWAEGRWSNNTAGDVIGDADTFFHHILTGRRCESARECFSGWSEPNKKVAEKWETLCMHIEELDGLEEIICTEESFGF